MQLRKYQYYCVDTYSQGSTLTLKRTRPVGPVAQNFTRPDLNITRPDYLNILFILRLDLFIFQYRKTIFARNYTQNSNDSVIHTIGYLLKRL
jgi:hypothetical protein